MRASRGDAAVLAVTFLLTVFRDLTEAIVIGFALRAVVFIHRMSQAAGVEHAGDLVSEDLPDDAAPRAAYAGLPASGAVVYRMTGALFFGAAASIGAVLDRIGEGGRPMVLDLTAVPFVDSSGAVLIEALARKAARQGTPLTMRATPPMLRDLARFGVAPPLV